MNPDKYQSQLAAAKAATNGFRRAIKDADSFAEKGRIITERYVKPQSWMKPASIQDIIDSIEDAGLLNDPEFKQKLQGLSSICNKF